MEWVMNVLNAQSLNRDVFKIDKYKIADQYYDNALQIRKDVFGANSHFYTSTLTNLALVNFKLKNNQRSFDYFEKAFVNRINNIK